MEPVDTSRESLDVVRERAARAAMLDDILAATTDHIYLFDREGRYVYVSPMGARTIGLAPEEMVGRTWQELDLPAEILEAFDANRRWVQSSGEMVTAELSYPTVDGVRDYEYTVTPYCAGGGEIAGTVVSARDVTERKRGQLALRESEARFRAVFEMSVLGIALAALDSRPVTTNPALQAMFGYSADELRATTLMELTHPDDVASSMECLRQLAAGEREMCQLEKRYLHKQGGVIWARSTISLVRDAAGTPLYALGIVEDISERRDVQDALRESEARFRAVFTRAGIGIVLVDAAGRFFAVNPMYERLLGYSADELEGRTFTELTHPDDVDLDWGLFEELRSGQREAYQIEKRYVRRDGRMRWVRLIASGVRDDSGAYRYAVGMVEDVTERRQAEDSRSRLVQILEATPDIVGIMDVDRNPIYVNRTCRELAGIRESDVPRMRVPEDFHPEWASSLLLREGLPAAIRAGTWRGETAFWTRDGREIPVSQVLLAHREDGRVRYISTIMRDISERKRTEEGQRFLLHASRALSGSLDFDATLEHLASLLVPARADFCLVDLLVDERAERRIAVHRDASQEGLMRRLRGYRPDTGRDTGIARTLRTGESQLIGTMTEPWLQNASEDEVHLRALRDLDIRSLMIVPLSHRGRVIGAVTVGVSDPDRAYTDADLLIAEDLGGRAALALENSRLFRNAQRATRMRDEVLRIVAHDLRGPLQGIAVNARMLHETLASEDDGRPTECRRIDAIRRSVDRSNRLIEDLLDVTRMEAGTLRVYPRRESASSLVEDAVEAHRPLADDRSIRLECQVEDDLGPVAVDRDRALQVFSNLIGNALKFTPKGGRVEVSAEGRGPEIVFTVSDSGPGIPEEERPHLFDRFWQGDHARTGAGLGLAIARGLVEAHGGQIGVESREGRGTTVSFTVPASS